MDTVVIVLLVLLGVIVLAAKGKPLWSKLKTLPEQLGSLWSLFVSKVSPFHMFVIWFASILVNFWYIIDKATMLIPYNVTVISLGFVFLYSIYHATVD